jgi:hypothetical protein
VLNAVTTGGKHGALSLTRRIGVRSRRFQPADVIDWIRRGAPTRVS